MGEDFNKWREYWENVAPLLEEARTKCEELEIPFLCFINVARRDGKGAYTVGAVTFEDNNPATLQHLYTTYKMLVGDPVDVDEDGNAKVNSDEIRP